MPRTPYGVSPSTEAYIRLPSGMVAAVESANVNPHGTSYVRILDKQGGEVVYWCVDEWEEDGENVMGAIFGAMMAHQETDDPAKFYQFAPDCKFPKGVTFEPCVKPDTH